MNEKTSGLLKLSLLILGTLIIVGGVVIVAYEVMRALKKKCDRDEVWNKNLGKCIPRCEKGTTYYEELDECSACPPNMTLKGEYCELDCDRGYFHCGGSCIKKGVVECLKGDIPCPVGDGACHRKYMKSQKSSSGSPLPSPLPSVEACCDNCVGIKADGSDDCCPKNYRVNAETLKCEPCPTGAPICGVSCCKPTQQCCDKQCCDKGLACSSSGNCCKSELLWTKPNGDTECCQYDAISTTQGCCDKGQTLVDGKCAQKCGDEICFPFDNPKSECKHVIGGDNLPDGRESHFDGCWTDQCTEKVMFHPEPGNLFQPGTDKSAGIGICKDNDEKLWFCNGTKSNLSYTTRNVSTTFKDPSKCQTYDCWVNVTDVSGSYDPKYNEDTGLCTASIDCDKNSDTGVKCDELLARKEGDPGWDTISLFNSQNGNYNKEFINDQSVICMDPDQPGKATGEICKPGTICDETGQCVRSYNITTDTDGMTKMCMPSYDPVDPSALGHTEFTTMPTCIEGLKKSACPKGFARAGYSEEKMGCYRYGFYQNWNPGQGNYYNYYPYCNSILEATGVTDKDGRMANSHTGGNLGHTTHSYCYDQGTTIPKGAYSCWGAEWNTDGSRLNPSPEMQWAQCEKDEGCKTSGDSDGPKPFNMQFSFDNGNSKTSIGYCAGPPHGTSIIPLKPPKLPHQ